MKKKLLSILLCLTMAVGLLPVSVWAAEPAHKHCICGLGTAEEHIIHTHRVDTEWVGISSLDEISSGSSYYYLKNNVTISKSWNPPDKTVLCLNGYSIICSASEDVIKVSADKRLTLTDCSTNKTGKITHTSGATGRGISNNGGTVTIWGGSVCDNSIKSVGAGIYNSSSAFLYMYGGSISNNRLIDYNHGAGVYNEGRFEMRGGTISGCYANGSGAGIFNYKGIFTMSGTAAIKDNYTDPDNHSAYGGGVDNYLGTFVMLGGEISGNRSNCGGGVCNYADAYSTAATKSATFTMTGGTISNNTADAAGGGVFSVADKEASAEFLMAGTAVITDNKAANGGGVCISSGGSKMTMSENALISNNTASDSTDVSNGNGGGIYFSGSGYSGYGTLEMKNGAVSENNARRGGGIYVNRGKLNASGGKILGNTAITNGGGVYVSGSNTVTLGGSLNITGNKKSTSNNNLFFVVTDLKVMAAGLVSGAKIGVTMPFDPTSAESVTITGDTVTKNYFVSDNASFETAIDSDGYVILKVAEGKSYTVKINLPSNGSASRVENTGDLEQTVKEGSDDYKLVKLKADSNHYFSNDDIKAINAKLDGTGMYVATVSESETISITGTPTKDVEITVVTTAKTAKSAPRVRGTAPETADGKGYINGTSYGMEYRKHGTDEWIDCSNIGYQAVEPGCTYEVRYKSTLKELASPISSCYVPEYTVPKVAEPTPESCTYDGKEHTGIALGSDYVVSSGTNTATDAGEYVVYIKPADGKQWADGSSAEKEFRWNIYKADKDAPTGLGTVKASAAGESDGKITGVSSDMEYRKVGTSEWISCTDTEIIGLAAGSYEVRYKESANYNAGKSAALTVTNTDAPVYSIIEGDGSSWVQNTDKTLSFRADGDFAKLTGIKIDGAAVASGKYTVDSDSNTVVLGSDLLSELTVGNHILTVVYSDGECSASFEVKAEAVLHTHDYGTEWKSDEKSHWHECACGEKADEAAHSFEWKVDKAPTEDETGLEHEECTVCGAKRNENTVIEKLSDDSKANDDSTTNDDTSPKTADGSIMWAFLLIISCGIIGALVIGRKRRYNR